MAEEVLVQRSKDILGGTPVFSGTRVPVQTLLTYIEEGDTLVVDVVGFNEGSWIDMLGRGCDARR